MNNVWITFADNEIYLKSAYALALSLNQVKSKYKLCVMIPFNLKGKNVNDFILATQSLDNIIIKRVPYLYFNFLENYKQNITINKFHLFALLEYDKICFLDADSYFSKNLDIIFDLDTPAIGYYYNDKNEQCLSGGIFLVKPSLELYSLILNLCITLEFYDDDNVFYYLAQENKFLKFNTYLNDVIPNYRNIILQEQKPNKFWAKFTYQDIYSLVLSGEGIQQLLNFIKY